MKEDEIFYQLFHGGNFSLPYLLKFTNIETGEKICLINDNKSVEFEGDIYEISTFQYTQPDLMGDGASLEISAIDNELIPFFENAKDNIRLDVVGLLSSENEIQKIKNYVHFFGNVSYGADMKIKYTPGKDDRIDMQFCCYVYDTANNKGNA